MNRFEKKEAVPLISPPQQFQPFSDFQPIIFYLKKDQGLKDTKVLRLVQDGEFLNTPPNHPHRLIKNFCNLKSENLFCFLSLKEQVENRPSLPSHFVCLKRAMNRSEKKKKNQW